MKYLISRVTALLQAFHNDYIKTYPVGLPVTSIAKSIPSESRQQDYIAALKEREEFRSFSEQVVKPDFPASLCQCILVPASKEYLTNMSILFKELSIKCDCGEEF